MTLEQNRNRHPIEGRRPDALIGLVIAIHRYMDHEIDIVEARRLILLVFAPPVDDCAHRDLVDYLDRLLDRLRGGDLSPNAVLNDIVVRATLSPASEV
ncbi:MAG: hypothetical protein NVV72_10260 [Asticcacaulis sp.]|nr:hypothetical protein [Asticcacaulis sp.]